MLTWRPALHKHPGQTFWSSLRLVLHLLTAPTLVRVGLPMKTERTAEGVPVVLPGGRGCLAGGRAEGCWPPGGDPEQAQRGEAWTHLRPSDL